jgi:hypothetical protein
MEFAMKNIMIQPDLNKRGNWVTGKFWNFPPFLPCFIFKPTAILKLVGLGGIRNLYGFLNAVGNA